MNRLVVAAVISTSLVIALGISLILPVFFTTKAEVPRQNLMLSFNIVSDESGTTGDRDASLWCQEVASIVGKSKIRATFFITGRVAETNPECVKTLSENIAIDIGSQTYSYIVLTSIDDYLVQLEEVRNGKAAVDRAANISSLVFKAPYGQSDQNIFSLLNRSNIAADFSYEDHYNKYHNGYYIWFNITSYEAASYDPSILKELQVSETPIVLNIDNRESSIEEVQRILNELNTSPIREKIRFVNASDLVGFQVTIRSSGKG